MDWFVFLLLIGNAYERSVDRIERLSIADVQK